MGRRVRRGGRCHNCGRCHRIRVKGSKGGPLRGERVSLSAAVKACAENDILIGARDPRHRNGPFLILK